MPTASGTGAATRLVNDTTPDLAFTMPATGARRAVILGFGAFDASALTVSSVTYGGAAMTQVVTFGTINTTGLARLYILVNPPTGANNFTVTFSGACDEVVMAGGGAVDVDQTTPTSAATTPTDSGNGNTSDTMTGTLDANDWLVGFDYSYDSAGHTITPTDTQIAESQPAGDASGCNLQYSTDGALNWTFSNTPDWQEIAFVLNHDGGGGGGDTNARLIGGDLLQSLLFGRLVN